MKRYSLVVMKGEHLLMGKLGCDSLGQCMTLQGSVPILNGGRLWV